MGLSADNMGLGATANTVQNLAKNFHYSQFQLSEIAAKGKELFNMITEYYYKYSDCEKYI